MSSNGMIALKWPSQKGRPTDRPQLCLGLSRKMSESIEWLIRSKWARQQALDSGEAELVDNCSINRGNNITRQLTAMA